MSIFHDDVREALFEYERTEDGLLLLEVFRRAAQYGIPVPPDAYLALNGVLDRYQSGECKTLDEAFNVKRPQNWKQPATQAKRQIDRTGMSRIGRLWHRGKELQAAGIMPTDNALWEALAAEFYVSPSRAKNWFYEVEHKQKN